MLGTLLCDASVRKKQSVLQRNAKYCDQQVFSDEVEITIILIE